MLKKTENYYSKKLEIQELMLVNLPKAEPNQVKMIWGDFIINLNVL